MGGLIIKTNLYTELSDEQIQEEIERLGEVTKKPQLIMRDTYALKNLKDLQERRLHDKQSGND